MIYSNGFFLFNLVSQRTSYKKMNDITFTWIQEENIGEYERYEYHWCSTSSDQLRKEHHFAPIWLHREHTLAIVFLTNHLLLSEVKIGLYEKFGYKCCSSIFFQNNQSIFNNKDILWGNNNETMEYHQVITNLLASDEKRIEVIEELLTGGSCVHRA